MKNQKKKTVNVASIDDFEASSAIVLKSLKSITPVIDRRSYIPVLSCVKSEGGKLTSTDLDVWVSETLPTDCVIPDCCFDPEPIARIAKNSGLDNISFRLGDGNRLCVSTIFSECELSRRDIDDFPETPELEDAELLNVDAQSFVNSLKAVAHCSSSELTRYYLNGVFIEPDGDYLNLVATDGHRMARSRIEFSGYKGKSTGWILPTKAISLITKMSIGENTSIYISDTRIKIIAGTTELVSKLIDGTYPDYRRVLPEVTKNKITLSTKDLKKALSLVSGKIRSNLKFSQSDDGIKLSCQVDDEKSKVLIEPEGDSNKLVCDFGLQKKYLIDCIANCGDFSIHFHVDDGRSPIRLSFPNTKKYSDYIIMPLRV